MNTALKTEFEKLLLRELRLVTYEEPRTAPDAEAAEAPGESDTKAAANPAAAKAAVAPDTAVDPELADERIVMAVTVNEELRNLGYTLKPADLLRLARSSSLTAFTEHFRSLLSDVKALPMYPDFPTQVMEMDEAQFRMHQMVHYFSTYGLETLFGVNIGRGWLPDMPSTAKTQKDDPLLKAKVLELIPEDEAPMISLQRILGKRERMNAPEAELVSLAIPYLKPEDLAGISVPFKENLTALFEAILNSDAGEDRVLFWRQICRHTGDVLKCVLAILPGHRFHFRTSHKRAIVKLLESYPETDFRANLILSRSKREKNLVVLQYLDYNMYSRSIPHRNAVRALRNGELRSWEAQAKYLLSTGADGALDFIALRPGMMLRMLRMLLRRGFSEQELREKLLEKADAISLHTIVDILNSLDKAMSREPREDLYRSNLKEMEEAAGERISSLMHFYSDEYIQEEFERREADLNKDHERIMGRIRGSGRSKYDFFEKYLQKNYEDREELREWMEKASDPELREHKILNYRRKERQRIEEYKRSYEEARSLYDRSAPYTEPLCRILKDVLLAHLKQARTDLIRKKVFIQTEGFDLAESRLLAGRGSAEGGYLPSGIAIRIPEGIKYLRFFVYWNDQKRVDLDLHAFAHDLEGNDIHVGWNADFKNEGIVHSGDITHSNAAEYIDIDLEAAVRDVETTIHIYYGKDSFKEIRECYVGMMAVKKPGKNIALYDPKNCFFTHDLRSDNDEMRYGCVDVQKRLLFFMGDAPYRKPLPSYCEPEYAYGKNPPLFSMEEYLRLLLESQEAAVVNDPEEADVILTLEKSADEKAVSLKDKNFYLEV